MKFPGTALVAAFVVATTVGDGADRTSAPPDFSTRLHQQPSSGITDLSYAPVQVGDPSPNFNWVGVDNQTYELRAVLQQANVLLIFAPSDEVLQAIETERDDLAQIAVVPIAVLDSRGRATANRARKLGVHYLVVPDASHLIGSQFSLLDPTSSRLQQSWYAVDRRGVVRGAGVELTTEPRWTRIAASALAIPSPDVPLPAKTR
jgi:peroxiredoxin